MFNKATISADIIAFTSLLNDDKIQVSSLLKEELERLSTEYQKYGFFGRLVQGDYLECALKNPVPALRIALRLKTFVKFLSVADSGNKLFKYFREHGLRIAVAVAPLEIFDTVLGILDGEAIYLSGRALKSGNTSDKQKIRIKETCYFLSLDKEQEALFSSIFTLIDTLLSKCSARQSEIVYYKLSGLSEKEISEKLGINQSTISQHSTAAGWHALEKAVNYFENYFA